MRRPALKAMVFALSTLALSALLMGCPKRPPTSVSQAPSDGQGSAGSAPAASPVAFTPPPAPKAFGPNQALKDVFFSFAKSDVRRADMATLDSVAAWLKKNPGWLVLIEGHTDDRGTRQENIAIGEHRAEWVKNYLVAKGVDVSRVSTVSYGGDRPLCADKSENCRARNRRVHFLVQEP